MDGKTFILFIVSIIGLIIGFLSGDEFSSAVVTFILKAGLVVIIGAILLVMILIAMIIWWLTKQRREKNC